MAYEYGLQRRACVAYTCPEVTTAGTGAVRGTDYARQLAQHVYLSAAGGGPHPCATLRVRSHKM